MSNETTLDDVLALVAKATPGEFKVMAETNVMAGDGYSATSLQSNIPGNDWTRNEKNAAAMVAAVNYLRAHGDELRAALEDARRYNKLKPMMTAANFHPEDPDGLDLGEGVALIFMLPKDTSVCADLDSIIDGVPTP